VTKDDFYKIGILIAALCVITWMFLSNSWGADSNPKSKPSAPDQWRCLMENRTSSRYEIESPIVCSYFSSRNSNEAFYGEMKNYCDSGMHAELQVQFKEGTVLLCRTKRVSLERSITKIEDGFRSISLVQVKWSKPIYDNGTTRFATGLKHLAV